MPVSLNVELARVPSELLAPAIAADFARLRISVSFFSRGVWRALQLVSNIGTCEVEHGGWPSRHLYNMRSLERVEREKRSVLGEHAGFFDLFVPVLKEGSVDAILVAGPFAKTRPKSTEVLGPDDEIVVQAPFDVFSKASAPAPTVAKGD